MVRFDARITTQVLLAGKWMSHRQDVEVGGCELLQK
jgi:hypothetical protein